MEQNKSNSDVEKHTQFSMQLSWISCRLQRLEAVQRDYKQLAEKQSQQMGTINAMLNELEESLPPQSTISNTSAA